MPVAELPNLLCICTLSLHLSQGPCPSHFLSSLLVHVCPGWLSLPPMALGVCGPCSFTSLILWSNAPPHFIITVFLATHWGPGVSPTFLLPVLPGTNVIQATLCVPVTSPDHLLSTLDSASYAQGLCAVSRGNTPSVWHLEVPTKYLRKEHSCLRLSALLRPHLGLTEDTAAPIRLEPGRPASDKTLLIPSPMCDHQPPPEFPVLIINQLPWPLCGLRLCPVDSPAISWLTISPLYLHLGNTCCRQFS